MKTDLTTPSQAVRWFNQALDECGLMRKKFLSMHESMLRAGFFFRKARESVPEGEFGAFVERFKDRSVAPQ